MALLLHIDTSVDKGSICLSNDDIILDYAECLLQKDQSAWLHPSIKNILSKNNISIRDLQAVSVVNGPGSYTGLRIGLAAAKGICYALSIPLIILSTLEVMASAVLSSENNYLICPMIDARRQEVFTAVYNNQLLEVLPAQALILDENSFSELLSTHPILFCGNGSMKWQSICYNKNAFFKIKSFDARDAVSIANQYFKKEKFANTAYSEPQYLKQVYIKS